MPGSSNIVGYKNEKVDEWIDELRVTFDDKRQIELYHKIQRQIYADQPCTFLFVEMQTGGLNGRIKNVKFFKIRPVHRHAPVVRGSRSYREVRPDSQRAALCQLELCGNTSFGDCC